MRRRFLIGWSLIYSSIIQILCIKTFVSSQLAWSPIQVDSESKIIKNKTTYIDPIPIFGLTLFSGQVDLWTRKSVGCQCLHHTDQNKILSDLDNTTNISKSQHESGILENQDLHHDGTSNCACCVIGGCQCGVLVAPNRCTQCGLEDQGCPYSKIS